MKPAILAACILSLVACGSSGGGSVSDGVAAAQPQNVITVTANVPSDIVLAHTYSIGFTATNAGQVAWQPFTVKIQVDGADIVSPVFLSLAIGESATRSTSYAFIGTSGPHTVSIVPSNGTRIDIAVVVAPTSNG